MSKMPKRDEDCCVDILALVHGGPTTTNEIVRQLGVRERSLSSFVKDTRVVIRTYSQFAGAEADKRWRVGGGRPYGVCGLMPVGLSQIHAVVGQHKEVIDELPTVQADLKQLREFLNHYTETGKLTARLAKLHTTHPGQAVALKRALDLLEQEHEKGEQRKAQLLWSIDQTDDTTTDVDEETARVMAYLKRMRGIRLNDPADDGQAADRPIRQPA
jgi:hypothetical protein